MKDFEKDKFIKDILQKDKKISSKAEAVFKNIDYTKNEIPDYIENKPKKEFPKVTFWLSGFLTVAASFMVVAFSAGTAIYVNRDKINGDNTPITTQSTRTAISGKIVKTGTGEEITVKNEEVKPEEIEVNNSQSDENFIIKEKEDEFIKVVLMSDNRVLIKLKSAYLDEMNWEGNFDNYIEIEGINDNVKDIFIDKGNAVLLLMEDGTVEYSKILNKEDSDFKEIYFYDFGKIDGLTNIMDFEQKEESIWNSDNKYYYVIAERTDKKKKEIFYDEYNDVDQEYETKSFTSQDGETEYTIETDENKYAIGSGWAGASNNVYYIKDSVLYHMSLVDGNTIRLATGVESIWQEEDGQIIVRAKKEGFVLHKLDQYIKIWDYDVSNAEIVETQENEYMILTRRSDNSLNLEFKLGSIQELFNNDSHKNKYLEHFVYNFYISANTQNIHENDEKCADASVMLLGTAGIDGKVCIVYASEDGKLCEIDLYEYMMNDKTGRFHVNNEYTWKQYDEKIESIKTISCEVEFEDGTIGSCDIQEYELEDGEVFYNLVRRPADEIFGTIKYPDGTEIPLRY